MKKIGFVCLHYGACYLPYAIKSCYDLLDEILIVYSDRPSHSHSTTMVCPDTGPMLKEAAFAFGDAQNKIKWVEGHFEHEGKHRDTVFTMYPNADLICVIDYDEIWEPAQFAAAQEFCLKNPVRNFKTGLTTLWRSFSWAVRDMMCPDRFYRPGMPHDTFAYVPRELAEFWHFGYAISAKPGGLMDYKLSCHGHKNEMRANWLNDKYRAWSPTNNLTDCHPTCVNIWNPHPFDKNLLPAVMKEHPWWDVEVIE